jgi:hypothetical protein
MELLKYRDCAEAYPNNGISGASCLRLCFGRKLSCPYGQKIETAQRRQLSNLFGLGRALHNKLAVGA